MGAKPPSRHAVPSRGRHEMGPAPLGVWEASSQFFFHILRPRGCILDKFWPIWLSVLALLRKAFAAYKDKNIMVIVILLVKVFCYSILTKGNKFLITA